MRCDRHSGAFPAAEFDRQSTGFCEHRDLFWRWRFGDRCYDLDPTEMRSVLNDARWLIHGPE